MITWKNGEMVVIDGEEENRLLCKYFKCTSDEGLTVKRKCPICGEEYEDFPAISRKDNITEICPTCGTWEALEAAGLCTD